jgi:integrase
MNVNYINQLIENQPTTKARKITVKKFAEYCFKMDQAPFPISLICLQMFLSNFMERNNGSTRSLSLEISKIKSHCVLEDLPWLSTSDHQKLLVWLRKTQYNDHTPSNQKDALTMKHLYLMSKHLSTSILEDVKTDAILWLGHDGLLRLGDLTSELRVSDIIWSPNFEDFDLKVDRTKTHRKGDPITIPFRNRTGPCAVKKMKAYFKLAKFNHKSDLLFPSIYSKSKIISESCIRNRIKYLCSKIGLDSSRFSGHSLRAGGATDLFNENVDYNFIKLLGRWKSDTALIYYRDKVGLVKAVNLAFKKLAQSLLRYH